MIEWRRERLHLLGAFTTRRTRDIAFEVLVVRVTLDGSRFAGFGEVSLAGTFERDGAAIEEDLARLRDERFERALLEALGDEAISELARMCRSPASSGVEMACLDLHGKLTERPLWALLGLQPPTERRIVTSITIGWSPEGDDSSSLERVQRLHPSVVKLKLGAVATSLPEGIERYLGHVRDRFPDVELYADVNCAWSCRDVLAVADSLRRHGVSRLEEPLRSNEDLGAHREVKDAIEGIDLFADERVREHDPAALAAVFDGVNLKPAELGGFAATAGLAAQCERERLRVQIGCIGESSVGIAASAQLAAAGGYLADLDSHLMLREDPFSGPALLTGGRLAITAGPGHGARPTHGFLTRAGWT